MYVMLFSINIVKKWLNKMRKKLYFGGHSTFSVFYRPFYFLNVTLMRIDVLEDNWNRND
jgi:hypothetical protein